jgi:CheY-like chemotaxis protein
MEAFLLPAPGFNPGTNTGLIRFDDPFSNGEIVITMLSSSKILPTTKVLNIDNYSDGRERNFGKGEPLAAIARHQDCDHDYEPGLGPRALAGLRILVVDDEPDCATLTGYLLGQSGADVKVALSATEALEVIERYQEWLPDILVSDIQMPAIDGYELMRRVRKMGPDRGGNIPAIALTAHIRDEDRVCALAAGFQIHMTKPFEPVELLRVVESLVNRRTEDRGSKIEG